jgi:hypothetical protein
MSSNQKINKPDFPKRYLGRIPPYVPSTPAQTLPEYMHNNDAAGFVTATPELAYQESQVHCNVDETTKACDSSSEKKDTFVIDEKRALHMRDLEAQQKHCFREAERALKALKVLIIIASTLVMAWGFMFGFGFATFALAQLHS